MNSGEGGGGPIHIPRNPLRGLGKTDTYVRAHSPCPSSFSQCLGIEKRMMQEEYWRGKRSRSMAQGPLAGDLGRCADGQEYFGCWILDTGTEPFREFLDKSWKLWTLRLLYRFSEKISRPSVCRLFIYSFCVWRFYAVPEVSDEITNKINLACERFPEWNGVSLLLNNNLHCRRKQFRINVWNLYNFVNLQLLYYSITLYYYLINDSSHLPIDLIPNQKKKKNPETNNKMKILIIKKKTPHVTVVHWSYIFQF